MSWFNRRPRVKEPQKLTPHHSSPIAQKMLEEVKKQVRTTEKPRIKTKKN